MNRAFAAAATIGLAGLSSAVTSHYSQPWTTAGAWPSWISTVTNCVDNAPKRKLALDDFILRPIDGNNTPITVVRIDWWGTVSSPDQLRRQYVIAFWEDNPAIPCRVDSLLFAPVCVTARTAVAGTNCLNETVYRFSALVSLPWTFLPNQRNWIQISEDDSSSVRVGKEDFFWAARQPVTGCKALQMNSLGAFNALTDPCNRKPDDLSFVLYR